MLTVYSPNRHTRRLLDGLERSKIARERNLVRELGFAPFSTSNTLANLTVNRLLRQPATVSRDLVNIILQRGGFVADRLLVRGSADQVAGGAMQFQRSGSSYTDRPVEEIAEDGDWPRTGWTEELRTAAVKTYGLEVPISGLSMRRNAMDQVTRAERRLANQIVKFVDTKAITLLRTDPDIQTMPASAFWTNAATDMIGDVAAAQELMDVIDEGLMGTVLVVNKQRRSDFLRNTSLRDALKTQQGSDSVRTGQVSNFLGLDAIYFTNQMATTEALLVDPGVAGTIADEAPDPQEGWVGFDPGPGFATIYVQIYPENRPKRKVVAAGRWPAMALIEPRAVVKITGIA